MRERRIRVGVNLLWLVPGVVGGSEEYVTRLLRALADLDPPDLDVQLFGLDELAVAHPDLAKRFPLRTIALRGRLKAAPGGGRDHLAGGPGAAGPARRRLAPGRRRAPAHRRCRRAS